MTHDHDSCFERTRTTHVHAPYFTQDILQAILIVLWEVGASSMASLLDPLAHTDLQKMSIRCRAVMASCLLSFVLFAVLAIAIGKSIVSHRRANNISLAYKITVYYPTEIGDWGVETQSLQQSSYTDDLLNLVLRGGYPPIAGIDASDVTMSGDEWMSFGDSGDLEYLDASGSNIKCGILRDLCAISDIKVLYLTDTDVSAECIRECLSYGTIETLAVNGAIADELLNHCELGELKRMHVYGRCYECSAPCRITITHEEL